MRVEWTDEASTDRLKIRNHLMALNPYAAKALLTKLMDAAQDLGMFPLMAQAGPENTREWPVVKPYVIIYEIDEAADTVRILRVWHSAQNRDS